MAGFGSLMLAQHQGLASLGKIMVAGIAGCMLTGLAFLPALLTLLKQWGWTATLPRHHPIISP